LNIKKTASFSVTKESVVEKTHPTFSDEIKFSDLKK
jgi:hypothetical protein